MDQQFQARWLAAAELAAKCGREISAQLRASGSTDLAAAEFAEAACSGLVAAIYESAEREATA